MARVRRRGRQASLSGAYGESIFASLCSVKDLPVVNYREWLKTKPACVAQFPCPHPFRPGQTRGGKNDYMVSARKTIYVQVKNQQTSGTTDEKLAFAFDIARYSLASHRFDEFWLVLLGIWWPQKPGIIEYARNKCREFEMLANGLGTSVKARVIVGPMELEQAMKLL